MKTLKRIGIFLLVIILLLCIISLFLPAKVHVERTTIINAESSVIFNQVNNLKNWPQWSPWFGMDPDMQVTYEGPEAGTGASYSWKGKKAGEGTMTITESRPHEYLATALDFKEGKATADFKFEKVDGGTKVIWSMDSDMGMNPVSKYFGLFMDQMLGEDFEKGLSELKKVSESYTPPIVPEINPMPGDSTHMLIDSTMKAAVK